MYTLSFVRDGYRAEYVVGDLEAAEDVILELSVDSSVEEVVVYDEDNEMVLTTNVEEN
jgi:hypothetical protein